MFLQASLVCIIVYQQQKLNPTESKQTKKPTKKNLTELNSFEKKMCFYFYFLI